jgi:glucose/arabinose dehydrogenase
MFFYYTQIEGKDGEEAGKQPVGNRVYRYELSGDALINPLLLMDLPANPGPRYNGGNIIIGPDNNIYVAIGDVDGSFKGPTTETKTQNYKNGIDPDGRSGILRITQNGQPTDGILGILFRCDDYAYGIRNSFVWTLILYLVIYGIQKMDLNGDEINLVLPVQ